MVGDGYEFRNRVEEMKVINKRMNTFVTSTLFNLCKAVFNKP